MESKSTEQATAQANEAGELRRGERGMRKENVGAGGEELRRWVVESGKRMTGRGRERKREKV
jgi:hypothetical protein